MSDLERCPTRTLAPAHWRDDGTCLHRQPKTAAAIRDELAAAAALPPVFPHASAPKPKPDPVDEPDERRGTYWTHEEFIRKLSNGL